MWNAQLPFAKAQQRKKVVFRLLDTLRFGTCSLGSWEFHGARYLMQTIKIMKFKMIWFDYIETVTIASA
ncbi:hypothetical protein Hanom_Chr14g01301821 [Helianthus anomalus]